MNLAATALVAGGLIAAGAAWWPLFVAGAGVSTLAASPDVDLAGKSRSNPVSAWGSLGFVWWPLGALTRHRGVTHTYLRGPALLLAYLALLAAPLLWLAWNVLGLAPPEPAGLAALLPFAAGFTLAHWLHLFADRIPLAAKRL